MLWRDDLWVGVYRNEVYRKKLGKSWQKDNRDLSTTHVLSPWAPIRGSFIMWVISTPFFCNQCLSRCHGNLHIIRNDLPKLKFC